MTCAVWSLKIRVRSSMNSDIQQQKWLEEGYGLLLSLSTAVIVKFVGWNVSKYNF